MILYEIEDMEVKEKGLVQFKSEEEAHRILVKKGFKCLEVGEFYAGHAKDNGNELSVMKAVGLHSNLIKEVNH